MRWVEIAVLCYAGAFALSLAMLWSWGFRDLRLVMRLCVAAAAWPIFGLVALAWLRGEATRGTVLSLAVVSVGLLVCDVLESRARRRRRNGRGGAS